VAQVMAVVWFAGEAVMSREEISFQGRLDKIDELLLDLSSIEEITDVKLESVASVNSEILGREPLNQFEVADIIISITINLASSVLYDLLRQKINDRAKKKGFTRKYNEIAKQQRRMESDH
jgi:hypothetical protein